MRKWWLWAMAMTLLVAPVFGACPNKCSGHGRCGINDVCDCMQNWVGGDCSLRLCPFARAWQDTAEGIDDAHYYQECANRGACDREKGICDCDAGFTGSGCRRMACPDDCSGHGTCEFIEDLAQNSFDKHIGGAIGRTYSLWDQEKIMGCKCDAGYKGHNCAKRMCPKGDDSLTSNQGEMVQAIYVVGVSMFGYLTYFDPYGNAFTTDAISFDTYANVATTCSNIQTALRRLPNNVLNTVTVTSADSFIPFTRDAPVFKATTGTTGALKVKDVTTAGTPDHAICIVKFRLEPGTTGYQHLLGCNVNAHNAIGQQPQTAGLAAGTCEVYEAHLSGTVSLTGQSLPLSELTECAGRGLCDYSTGICKCYSGHMGIACEKQEALV